MSTRLKNHLRKWLLADAGTVAIVAAFLMPVFVGMCGLGIETGYWYYRQRDVQAAADIAAYNGTVLLRSGGSSTAVTYKATSSATENGWHAASGTIAVHTPPLTGPNQNTRSVEVLLTETEERYFTQLFADGEPSMSVRGVATYTVGGPACMLGLSKTKSGTVQFWGNATAQFNSCNVISNSIADDSFKLGGSANVHVPCVSSSGGSQATSGLHLTDCGSVTTQAPQAADPYANVPAPTIPAACTTLANNTTPSPGVKYCSGFQLQGTMTLAPGTYIISGTSFSINANANISGTGVTFYLTNGATMSFNGNSETHLSAPTAGTYKGLLFYGDRTQSFATNTLNGNNSSVMTGAVYFPSQQVSFLGNFSGNNGCLQVVADVIYYTGNGNFNTDCSSSGLNTIDTPGAVALVE